MGSMGFDTWFEVASIIEGIISNFLFFYLIFLYKDKCPHCVAREEIEKDKNRATQRP